MRRILVTRRMLGIAAALAIAWSTAVGTGPVSAQDTPQTRPTITSLTLTYTAARAVTATLTWSGEDGDPFQRTGFCIRHQPSSGDSWTEQCKVSSSSTTDTISA